MKKLLILTYHFPPCAFGCCIRAFNFTKFLPENQYLPVVLSVLPKYYKDYSSTDDIHLKELSPLIKLIRTESLEPLGKLRPGFNAKTSISECENLHLHSSTQNIFARLLHWLERYVLLPDVQILWLPFALAKGYKAIKNDPEIKAVYAAAPPFSVFITALLIRKMTKKPLIADFKDMWVGRNQHERKSIVCQVFSRWMEKKIVSSSSKVLLNTSNSLKHFQKRYPNEHPGKFCLLLNGYDPKAENYRLSENNNDQHFNMEDKFHIVHSGIIDTDRNPKNFILALGELCGEKPRFKEKLVVSFAGKFHNSYLTLVKNQKLENNFKYLGYLEYENTMKLLGKATILLLITTVDAPDAIPGKLYEYFVFLKPILAIMEEGACKELLRSENVGFIASHKNREEIKKCIWEVFSLFEKNKISDIATVKNPEKYNRRKQTKDLSKIIDEIL